jgi:hypothetical protein
MPGIDEFFDRLELSLMAMINQDSEQRVSAILSASGHLRPRQLAPKSSNVRCCPNSDLSKHEAE